MVSFIRFRTALFGSAQHGLKKTHQPLQYSTSADFENLAYSHTRQNEEVCLTS